MFSRRSSSSPYYANEASVLACAVACATENSVTEQLYACNAFLMEENPANSSNYQCYLGRTERAEDYITVDQDSAHVYNGSGTFHEIPGYRNR